MKGFAVLGLLVPVLLSAGAPALKPGEGLAVAQAGGVHLLGDARTEGPLGDLACLPWLRLEGYAWSSAKLVFRCKGTVDGQQCSDPKGHGRVDLGKAFEKNCRFALLGWIQWSAAGWSRLEGPAIARLKLQEVFQPFLGARFAQGDSMPTFGPEWVGEGDFLRASPESLVRWLADPAQEEAESMFRRYGAGFFEGDVGDYQGWTYVGRSGRGALTCTWVAGGQAGRVAVLRMPGAPGREEAVKRFRELTGAAAR